jgi:hypothetical protein
MPPQDAPEALAGGGGGGGAESADLIDQSSVRRRIQSPLFMSLA